MGNESYEIIAKENESYNMRHMESIVRDYAHGLLNKEINILLASFQSMYEYPDEIGYLPVEISLKMFSLENGFENDPREEFYLLYDIGPPPRGLAAEAFQFAQKTHKIDPYNPRQDGKIDK